MRHVGVGHLPAHPPSGSLGSRHSGQINHWLLPGGPGKVRCPDQGHTHVGMAVEASRPIETGISTEATHQPRWCACTRAAGTAANPELAHQVRDHPDTGLVPVLAELGRDPPAARSAASPREHPRHVEASSRRAGPRSQTEVSSTQAHALRKLEGRNPEKPALSRPAGSWPSRRAAISTAALGYGCVLGEEGRCFFQELRSSSASPDGSRLPSLAHPGPSSTGERATCPAPDWHSATLSPSCPKCPSLVDTQIAGATSATGSPVSITFAAIFQP